jgi:hypothetical protein
LRFERESAQRTNIDRLAASAHHRRSWDALAGFDGYPVIYDPSDVAHAGVFVNIDKGASCLSIEALSDPRTRRRSRWMAKAYRSRGRDVRGI